MAGLSRPKRWSKAVAEAAAALSALETAQSKLDDALSELEDIRQEYETWKDSLPENLAQSALGEKLDAVADLDISSPKDAIETAVSDVSSLVSDAEGLDLPMGFGRD